MDVYLENKKRHTDTTLDVATFNRLFSAQADSLYRLLIDLEAMQGNDP